MKTVNDPEVGNLSIDFQPVNNRLFEAEAHLLKVLNHPVRLAILHILRTGEHCVCHMEAHLGYRQAYISQQLMLLREAGLVQDRRDGWNVFYHVTDPRVFSILTAVEQMVAPEIRSHTEHSPIACPCPKCRKE
jgi:ArsR family transcriptional regulator